MRVPTLVELMAKATPVRSGDVLAQLRLERPPAAPAVPRAGRRDRGGSAQEARELGASCVVLEDEGPPLPAGAG